MKTAVKRPEKATNPKEEALFDQLIALSLKFDKT